MQVSSYTGNCNSFVSKHRVVISRFTCAAYWLLIFHGVSNSLFSLKVFWSFLFVAWSGKGKQCFRQHVRYWAPGSSNNVLLRGCNILHPAGRFSAQSCGPTSPEIAILREHRREGGVGGGAKRSRRISPRTDSEPTSEEPRLCSSFATFVCSHFGSSINRKMLLQKPSSWNYELGRGLAKVEQLCGKRKIFSKVRFQIRNIL